MQVRYDPLDAFYRGRVSWVEYSTSFLRYPPWLALPVGRKAGPGIEGRTIIPLPIRGQTLRHGVSASKLTKASRKKFRKHTYILW
jgi:hypothetical protein